MISVLVESFEPFPRHLSLSLPSNALASDVLQGFEEALSHDSTTTFAATHHGRRLAPSSSLCSLATGEEGFPVVLQVRALLRGGKGGFGSMLRSQGGKMSANARNTNNDACRDLNGRRLGVLKEAKKLAEYLEGESERKRQMDEAQKKKYAKLERMLGRAPRSERDLAEAVDKMMDAGEDFDDRSVSPEAGPSRRPAPQSAAATGSKRKERIEDSEYIEQSREIVENVRSAVASAMMKKKKKLNKAPGKSSTKAASGSSLAATS